MGRPTLHPVEIVEGAAVKRCSHCLESKSVDSFSVNRSTGNLYSCCKDCRQADCRRRRSAKLDVYRKSGADRRRIRYQADPAFRLSVLMRNRISIALRGRASKSASTAELLGCSTAELVEHLERLFLPGMTWDNYGKRGWHVDHVKPCASFDLTDPDEARRCFHYTNLQPLWAEDNHSKGGRHG